MSPVDSAAIERFVRGTLGCGCPDQVFNSVAIEHVAGPGDSQRHTRLLVGNRLLIYILIATDREQVAATLPVLARRGCDERDRNGLNRFRLVIVAGHPTRLTDTAPALFADAIGADDRAHLHVIAPELLPTDLR
jgi:hypothetical protein